MPDYSAGTASIRMVPDATNFLRDLEAKLRAMRDPNVTIKLEADVSQGRRDAQQWRREEERNTLNVGVDADLADAVADMTKWRQEQERRGIEVPVDVDFEAAKMALDMWRRDQESNAVAVPVEAQTGAATMEMARWRAMQEANPVNVHVKVDVDRGGIDGVNRQLEGLRRSDVLRLNVGALGLAGLQPAATALAQVAASLQQVSQAGLVLPGVFAGAAASIGTLVLGLSGISDAYKAVSEASDSSAKDQAANAQSALSASNNLRNAVVDEARAREDVVRATRQSAQELRDLRTEQRGGMIDESRAILEARKAREDLAKGNYSDVRDAVLRVAEADQRLIETRNRNATTAEKLNDANRKGVDGADAVRDANERLVRTQQAVAEAQLANAAAASKQSSAQEKAAETMGALGANAREVVQTFVDLTPEFEKFRAKISDPLLEGKAKEFEDFFNTMRPVAERGLSGIAEGLNQNISAFLGSVSSQRGQGILDRILGNTGEAQKRLSAAMSPLVEGLGILTAAGTDALPRLADGFADVLDRFRDFIVEADEDGRLEKWIDEGLDGVTSLGNSLLNVGKTFTAITKAVGGGQAFLQWLETATGRLQTFLNSTEGQSKLKEYFDQGKETIREFVPLLQELPGALKAIADGASLYVGGGLLPLLTTVADLIGDHPELVKVAVAAWLAWKTINPIMSSLQGGILAFNNGLIGIGTNLQGTKDKAAAASADIDKSFKNAGKDGSGLNKFTRSIGSLAVVGGPFGVLATTIAGIAIPALLDLGSGMDKAAEKTKALEDRQKDLEQTLDRVSGKMTGQTLDSQLSAAQNFAPVGSDRDAVAGIKERDALAAATALNISPELYGKGLLNDPKAQNEIRSILLKNNLLPEFEVNQELAKRADAITGQTGGEISRDLLMQALIGDPGAMGEYNRILVDKARGNPSLMQRGNLADIAGSLSQTGQQSVLAGAGLGYLTGQTNLGLPTQQANQAKFGRFRLTPAGQSMFGGDFQVNATGPKSSPDTKYRVTTGPDTDLTPRLAELKAKGIEAVYNEYARVWELTVPQNSGLVEGYKTGGPTKGARNQGFLAELHGQEWVHDADTVDTYGKPLMNALWRKQIDPKAIQALVPGFDVGGPTDPNDPNYAAKAGAVPAGPAPGPVAPNAHGTGGGGLINDVTGMAVDGAQGPLGTFGSNLLGNFGINVPGATGSSSSTDASKSGITPGLWGLAEVGDDPDKKQMWEKQTLDWLVNDWVGGTIVGGLMNSVLPNVLGAVGLGGILNNPVVSGFTQGLNHFLSMGNGQNAGAVGGMVTLPDGTQVPAEQFLTPTTNGAGGSPLQATFLSQLFGGGAGGVAAAGIQAPTGAGNKGLQINTLRGKSVIQANFPWATDIGGVRADALKWHPQGLALDVMIPGAKGLNDPTPPQGKAEGDQLYAWLTAHKDELGIDYILWQEKDHYNHLHVNFAPSGYPDGTEAPTPVAGPKGDPATGGSGSTLFGQPVPAAGTSGPVTKMDAFTGFKTGGHTPGSKNTPVPILAHGDEFVHRNEAVEKYVLPFMNAVNDLRLDPADIPQMAIGGSVRGALQMAMANPRPAPPPVDPRRNPAKRPTPPPAAPAMPRPAPPPPPVAVQPPAAVPPPAPATPAPTPATPPVESQAPSDSAPTFTPEGGASGAAPTEFNHTLGWVDTAIESGAATIGALADSAVAAASMGATMGMGGGASGIGNISIGGMIQQGGKIVQGVANVISSALVGSVPGSFMTTPEAYGQTMRSEKNNPQTAMPAYGQGRNANYYIEGVDTRNMLGELQMRENIEAQAALAAHPGRA